MDDESVIAMMRRVKPRNVDQMAKEWDLLAETRTAQLDDGLDISYFHVLMPAVLQSVGTGLSHLLDVGCGTGVLTQQLAKHAEHVVGIDPSVNSIAEAAKRMEASPTTKRVDLTTDTVERYAAKHTGEKFSAIVANMTLMDSPNLDAVTQAVAKLLEPGGIFVWTITHPWFWPRYWSYDTALWFKYQEELFIEAEFRISNSATGLMTTHIHRPLERYIHSMNRAGMMIERLDEPMPTRSVMQLYPRPWDYPRFLAGVCRINLLVS